MENIVTNYYVSNANLDFKLSRKSEIKPGRRKYIGSENDETLSNIMPVRFADECKINHIYLTILRNFKIDQINNEEIVTLLYPPHEESNSGHTINAENSESSMIMPSDRFEDYSQIIRLRIHKNWNIGSLCAKFGLTKEELTSIFN